MTFAFSTLIGVILYLWWDKPFNVRCSAPVHLVEVATEQVTSDTFLEDDLFPENRCLCCFLPLDALSTALEGEAATGDQIGTNNHSHRPLPVFGVFHRPYRIILISIPYQRRQRIFYHPSRLIPREDPHLALAG